MNATESRSWERLSICLSLLLATSFADTVASAAPPDIALKAQQLLRSHCHVCHGQDGADEGGFNHVLSRDRMVATERIVPGKPDESPLFTQVKAGRMPKDGELLAKAEQQILRDWITAGAPDFDPPQVARSFLGPEYVYSQMQADLTGMPAVFRHFVRYFSIAHLYNAGVSEDELASYRHGLSKLVNSLSTGPHVVQPKVIDPAGTVLRIDLRDYAWDDDTWNRILEFNPYGVEYELDAATFCREQTTTGVPMLHADWFVHEAARPPLYHDILEIPETSVDAEAFVRIDVAEDIHEGRVARAGFNGSGVSRNNRLIERHATWFGAYWQSYDFGKNSGSANLFSHPLGPGPGQNDFQHDGGEIILSLPNGLQAYMLVDSVGNRIDEGPTNIVADPKSPNQAVINGISCMSCHNQGMIDKVDQVRNHVLKSAKAFTAEDREAVLKLYPPAKEMAELFAQDRERFRIALEATGANFGRSDPIYTLARRFEAELDLAAAAAEAGLRPQELLDTLDKAPDLARTLGPLATGLSVQREVFANAYSDLMYQFPGRTPLAAMAADFFDLPAVWQGKATETSNNANAIPVYDMNLTLETNEDGKISGTIAWPKQNNTITKFEGTVSTDLVQFTETGYASENEDVGIGAVYVGKVRGDFVRGEWTLSKEGLEAKGAFDLKLKRQLPLPE